MVSSWKTNLKASVRVDNFLFTFMTGDFSWKKVYQY